MARQPQGDDGGETLTASGGLDATLPSPPDRGADLVGKPSNRYDLLGEHARGGMGRVIAAYDRELDRSVALKELHESRRSSEARFIREAKITARLEHPGIVPVHEVGRWPDGRPYYAMKLVSGRALDDVIADAGSFRDRLSLLPHVLAVAEAIGYAHSERIIHRDLKPSNVIIGDYGETVVIDWGLAKDLTDLSAPDLSEGPYRDSGSVELTQEGAVMGTPAFMSPEQARGEAVDERADVYALGGMLYFLLSGEIPFKGPSVEAVLAKVKGEPPRPIELVVPQVPRDLAAIVDKAMQRRRDLRYPNAKSLAEDLARFHTGKLVEAHAYTWPQLARRWLRRHRTVVAVAGVALAALAVVGVLSVRRIVQERNDANYQRRRAEAESLKVTQERNRLQLVYARGALDRDPTEAVAALKQYPASADDWAQARDIAAEATSRGVATHLFKHAAVVQRISFTVDDRAVVASDNAGRLVVWDLEGGGGQVLTHDMDERSRSAFAINPMGKQIAYPLSGGLVVVHDPSGGNDVSLDAAGVTIRSVAFSRDGELVAGAGDDGSIHVWSADGSSSFVLHGHKGPVDRIEFGVSRALVSCGSDRELLLWNVTSRRSSRLGTCNAEVDLGFAVSLDGTAVATGQIDNSILFADLETGKRTTLPGSESAATVLALSGDGGVLAVGDPVGGATLWEPATGRTLVRLQRDGKVTFVSLSDTGDLLLTGDETGEVRVAAWRSADEWTLKGHHHFIAEVHLSHDGHRIVSADADGMVRVWQTPDNRPERSFLGHAKGVFAPTWTPDGKTLATAGADTTVRTWSLTGEQHVLEGHTDLVFSMSLSPDGRTLASASWDGTIRLWDVATGQPVSSPLEGHTGIVRHVVWSPSGDALASAGADRTVRLWNPRDGSQRTLGRHDDEVYRVAFSPDGAMLASAGVDPDIRLWDLRSMPSASSRLQHGRGGVYRIAFDPSGKYLASGGWRGRVVLWDVAKGTGRTVAQHDDRIMSLAFSPDGRWLASGSLDKTIAYVELAADRAHSYRGHRSAISSLAFSPDSRRLASGDYDGAIHMLDLASRASWVYYGSEARVFGLAFDPEGKHLAATTFDGVVRIWPGSAARPIEPESAPFLARLDEMTTVEVDSDGRLIAQSWDGIRTQ